MTTYIIIGAIVLAVVVLIAICATGYVKAPPDMAYIITGWHEKPRFLIGKAGIKIPFIERIDKLPLGAVQIDVKTKQPVPTKEVINVNVDSTVTVRICTEKEVLAIAAQNFLNQDKMRIAEVVNEVLEGNIREIVGTMTLLQMIQDRKSFCEKVQENAVPDLQKYGLELVTFNVQNFRDDDDVIKNLGIDNVSQIRKGAAIAKSNAEREIAIADAQNKQQANEAQVQADQQIAEQQADLARKKAALKKDVDTSIAIAEAAKGIEAENQRKQVEVAFTNANIAKAEREAELKQKEIQLKEYELDALVRKQADADKYAAEQAAAADLIRRQKDAEAAAYEMRQKAEALKAQAEAEKYAAEQKAEGIAAIGKAEAEAIEKKAEAQKKMGEASVIELYLNALPEIVRNAAIPLENVDRITMYGGDNSSKLVGDVMKTTNQIIEGLAENGLNLPELLTGIFNKKEN